MGEGNWLRNETGWQTACRSIKALDLASKGSEKLFNLVHEPCVHFGILTKAITISALTPTTTYLIIKSIPSVMSNIKLT